MPRSASTWSFNVCVRLISHAYPDARLYTGFDNDLTKSMEGLDGEYDHLVLKSHRLDRLGRNLVILGAAKAVYTFRDPQDAIASYMVMFEQSFDEALAAILNSVHLYNFHRRCGNCALISYESIVRESFDAVARVQTYLGLENPPNVVRTIAKETGMEAMRHLADRVGENSDSLVVLANLKYDRHSLLHRNHIRHGGIGYGRTFLSDVQRAKVESVIGAALESRSAHNIPGG
jgi:Sulfotransferase domain